MNIQSLGFRTDLFFPRFEGEIDDRGDYLVVKTPQNPQFHWGNFVLFDRPPTGTDLELWREIFQKEFSDQPEVRHQCFGWDGVDGTVGDLTAFEAAGFRLDHGFVLTAESVNPPKKSAEGFNIRPFREDWEWEAAVENRVINREMSIDEDSYRRFSSRQMDRYRAMMAAGHGRWFGAFAGNKLAGDLGVFVFDGVGRFQSVGTHPNFRRRGVCQTLLATASQSAMSDFGAQKLVIVAEYNSVAAGLYEHIGFVPTEHQMGISRVN